MTDDYRSIIGFVNVLTYILCMGLLLKQPKNRYCDAIYYTFYNVSRI